MVSRSAYTTLLENLSQTISIYEYWIQCLKITLEKFITYYRLYFNTKKFKSIKKKGFKSFKKLIFKYYLRDTKTNRTLERQLLPG